MSANEMVSNGLPKVLRIGIIGLGEIAQVRSKTEDTAVLI